MKAEPQTQMERASDELERRSRYLSSLIRQQRTKLDSLVLEEEQQERPETLNGAPPKTVEEGDERKMKKEEVMPANVRIRASDMAPELQKRAFRCAREVLDEMPKLDSKRFALTLKKEFDTTYGPAWHCIVGTSFGSYVTHSVGGFLYFSIDKVYILLFRTAVEPLAQ